MVLILKHRCLTDFANLSAQQTDALLDCARGLRSGAGRSALRGRNLGLLCDESDDIDAALLRCAAAALGAQLTPLRPNLSASSLDEVRHTARVLGRLYDALDCVGMAPALVRQIGVEAGVPVFESIASRRHPIARLADRIDDAPADDERRCLLIQAVLLHSL